MGFIVFIHVIVCIVLVITILMQAGRGGGLAESFSSAESMFGTQTNSFMVRLSSVLATIFIATSLILAVNSSKKDQSLMNNKKLVSKVPVTAPVAVKPQDKATVTVSDPKPTVVEKTAPAAPVKSAVVTTNSAK